MYITASRMAREGGVGLAFQHSQDGLLCFAQETRLRSFCALDDKPLSDLRLALNQDQLIGNERSVRDIEAMTGQRREPRKRGRPRKRDEEGEGSVLALLHGPAKGRRVSSRIVAWPCEQTEAARSECLGDEVHGWRAQAQQGGDLQFGQSREVARQELGRGGQP